MTLDKLKQYYCSTCEEKRSVINIYISNGYRFCGLCNKRVRLRPRPSQIAGNKRYIEKNRTMI